MIDADIHNAVPKVDALFPYLPPIWIEYIQQSAFKGPTDTAYPKGAPTTAREGTTPEGGGPPGSELELLRKQALPDQVDRAILNCLYSVDSVHNPDSAMALARAVNDWQAHEWLRAEPRLRASIVVPIQNPTMAADELRRASADRGFVQVLVPARTRLPLGNRLNWPLLIAAAECDVVVGIHFGGAPGNPPTPSGWPSTYVEEYAAMSTVAQSQLISLVAEGVLDELPMLRVSLIECGWTWLPSLMRQLGPDRLARHCRLTLTPTHPPAVAGALAAEVVRSDGLADMLMYSSDYPHAHAEEPRELLSALPTSIATKIRDANARAWYRLA